MLQNWKMYRKEQKKDLVGKFMHYVHSKDGREESSAGVKEERLPDEQGVSCLRAS